MASVPLNYRTLMKVRCTIGRCPCQSAVDVEVFQVGTSQVVEHRHGVSCTNCDHRWDAHSGRPEPPPS
jgi:hypothetical protein